MTCNNIPSFYLTFQQLYRRTLTNLSEGLSPKLISMITSYSNPALEDCSSNTPCPRYHTGPKLHPNDIKINEIIKKYCADSVLVIIDAKPKDLGLPTDAYIAVEEVHDDGTPTTRTFDHVKSEIGAEEAEEVGVEHLLRDIKDTTVGTLSQHLTTQVILDKLF